jgi:hypothetical protein
MLETKAVFKYDLTAIETENCVVDKVIRLSGKRFDWFSRDLMREWDFIRNNPMDATPDEQGRLHCLLVVGEGRRDGILVNSGSASFNRRSAFMPNAEDFLTVGRSRALSELNQKATAVADCLEEMAVTKCAEDVASGAWYEDEMDTSVVDLREAANRLDLDTLMDAWLFELAAEILAERHHIYETEPDGDELIVHWDDAVVDGINAACEQAMSEDVSGFTAGARDALRKAESFAAAPAESRRTPAKASEERPSTLARIRAAQAVPKPPREKKTTKKNKDKGDAEL